MNPEDLYFLYTDRFSKNWDRFGLTFDQLRDFESVFTEYLENMPSNSFGHRFPGKIVKGTGGAYKLRYANPNGNQGKSGSFRTIYFVITTTQVLFFDIYSKHEKASLSGKEKQALRKFSNRLKEQEK